MKFSTIRSKRSRYFEYALLFVVFFYKRSRKVAVDTEKGDSSWIDLGSSRFSFFLFFG